MTEKGCVNHILKYYTLQCLPKIKYKYYFVVCTQLITAKYSFSLKYYSSSFGGFFHQGHLIKYTNQNCGTNSGYQV